MPVHPDADIANAFARGLRVALGANVAAVYWFGSRAVGRGSADSDYDILVETHEPVTDAERDAGADIAVDLTAEHGILFDVHYYSTAEFRSSPCARTPFIEEALQRGVAL